MPKLVLVDGSSYLFRAFYALPDLRTSSGEPTGALRGVLSMLRRLVLDGKPDYFAVVFDAPGKTFRDDWYAEYKSNRKAMPDDLSLQVPALHELVRANGWPLLMIDGVEADDVIGTLAVQAKGAGIDTVISTSDKDLAQLVVPGVKLVNTMSNETLDEEGVTAKFGVSPQQVLDLLTLTGDSVDNVPGVPKVGPKTAAKWLSQYGTLDNIIAHANEFMGVIGDNLRQSLAWLPQGRALLTVKTDCDLPVKPGDLVMAPIDVPTLRRLYQRFEFKPWLRELPGGEEPSTEVPGNIAKQAERENNLRRFVTEPSAVPTAPPQAPFPTDYEIVRDDATLTRWLATIESAEVTSFDTETTSLDPMTAEIVGISLSVETGRACYIPVAHCYTGVPEQLDRDHVLARFADWLASHAHKKVGQNVKFDQHVLRNHGITLAGADHDTL